MMDNESEPVLGFPGKINLNIASIHERLEILEIPHAEIGKFPEDHVRSILAFLNVNAWDFREFTCEQTSDSVIVFQLRNDFV